MPAGDRVRIARRFLRSVRIDSDFGRGYQPRRFRLPAFLRECSADNGPTCFRNGTGRIHMDRPLRQRQIEFGRRAQRLAERKCRTCRQKRPQFSARR